MAPSPSLSPPLSLGGSSPFETAESNIDRFVLATAEQMANRGAAAVSARSVAQAAGAAPSAINYNFGGIERLFCRTFAHGAALTADWTEGRRREIAALPNTPEGAALALEHVIAEWTGSARPLALLYQEALAGWPDSEPVLAWVATWRDFWRDAAATLGQPETAGRLMHAFFESEALYHLSAWSPALERAALREMCGHFAAVWLGAARPLRTGALDLAERTAGVLRDGAVPATAMKIVEAAAEVVEAEGLGGLTHRAVAARAGVTTGSVTHHFRTIEDLVAGTIRGQVLAMNRTAPPGAPRPSAVESLTSPEALFAGIRRYAVTERLWGPALRRRQLFLAAVRRPELAGAGAVIRFAHGGTLGEALVRIFKLDPGLRSLYAGVAAMLAAGSWFACRAEPSPFESQGALVDDILSRLAADLAR